MYSDMLRIRHFEEEAFRRLRRGELLGELHQYNGQEAVAVGVCAALAPDDVITSTHRGHGHLLARGGDTYRMMAELFGKADGYCRGKGGSFHIADTSLGVYGANGIVGAGAPHAVGAALAGRLQGRPRVAVAFFGDGAMNQGVVHESMNLAAALALPVIFVCENNSWAISFSARRASKVVDYAQRASGYGMPGRVVDGMDVRAVFLSAREAVESARAGGGPQLLEAKTYRFEGHFSAEEMIIGQAYRDSDEIAMWRSKDPIGQCRRAIESLGLASAADLDAISDECLAAAVAAADAARSAAPPDAATAYEDLYATPFPNGFPKGW
jgi:pyruvate dehydrogenase E1 component alpha subunit